MIWALHGAMGAPSDWDACGIPMEAIDLYESAPVELEDWGGEFAGRVSRKDERPVVLGYSMGGRLALHALLAQPSLWKAAIIVSAHPGIAEEKERRARIESDRQWAEHARTTPWGEFLERWNAQPVFGGGAILDGSLENEVRRDRVAEAFEVWSTGRQSDLLDRLWEVSCPLLWVAGEKDEKFTNFAKKAVSVLPAGRIWIVEGAGHRVPWEIPDKFCAKVLAFLEECGIE